MKLIILIVLITLANCNKSVIRNNNNNNSGRKNLTSVDWLWTLNKFEKELLCFKNVSDCIIKDGKSASTSTETLHRLSSAIFSVAPPFDPSRTKQVSQICKEQSKIYIRELKQFQLWALKLYDSTAKIPTGILNGNINQFGDFDMCLNSNAKKFNISGKYCLASLQIETSRFTERFLSVLHKLSHSHYHFRSTLDDPEHRVPQFSSTKWGVCVPNGCSAKDVEISLDKELKSLFKNVDLSISVRVNSEMCQSEEDSPAPSFLSAIIICVFVGFIVLALFATFYDYCASERKSKVLTSFSLIKNVNSLLKIQRSSDDIEAIHGIRFLNAILLVLAHKSMALFFLPYSNRTEMTETLAQSWTVLARAASLYTDPFIMISGTLTAYSLFSKLKKTGKIHFYEEYISRLMRIVPTFAALIAFCTFILPRISNGPLWNVVVTHHSEICRKNWWRNLLFIHNYYGLADMCLTHTHHVGIDTQLFFVSPFLVLLLWKFPKKGGVILIGLGLVSTFLRYYVTYTMNLSNYVYFGTSVKQLFETADNMYILPAHRFTVYAMGIFLGYILRNYTTTLLTKSQLRMGNAAAVLSFAISFWGNAFMGNINYHYKPMDAAWYAAFSPILWCFSFAWIIFTTHCGHRGLFERIFSAKIFSYWTKISYTVYLTQFPLFFYNVGTARTVSHYNFIRNMFNLSEFFCIVIASVLLNLLFEAPFQNLRNVLFEKTKKEIVVKEKNKEKLN